MNKQQRKNLKKLANYLLTGESSLKFDMIEYSTNGDKVFQPPEAVCGTVACALGHGPAAGIIPDKDRDVTWTRYMKNHFGIDRYAEEGDFLFSSIWADYDNTKKGAAKRIKYYLKHGFVKKDETDYYDDTFYVEFEEGWWKNAP